MLDRLRQDVTFSVRSLGRNRLFTGAALLTLALGVGATTSMFSVVDGVLLEPLPYPDPGRTLALATRWADAPDRFDPMSRPDILDLEALPAFERVVGYTTGSDVLVADGSVTVVPSARVTSGLLAAFGLRPLLGRDIRLEESTPGHRPVVVVSHGFWRSELGADPDVLGRALDLDGVRYEVVGVAPAGFDFPEGTRLWRPHVTDPERCGRGCHNYAGIGRTAAPGTLALAREQADILAARLARVHPGSNAEKSFHVRPLEEYLLGEVRAELWVLLGAVGLVLLVACTNVASLLLARGRERASELAVRASLGAGRGRLTRQLLTESLVLALGGGCLGLGLAHGSAALLRRFPPGNIPRIAEVGVDTDVVLFSLGLVLLVAVAFGLTPALHVTRAAPAGVLGTSHRGTAGSRSTARFRQLLVASEVALALLLLVGSGLLVRTLGRLRHVQPGFRVEDVTRFDLVLPEARYGDLDGIVEFYDALEDRIRALPAVASVGSVYGAPMARWGSAGTVLVDGRPEPAPGEETGAALRSATPGYLEVQGISLLRGRGIEPTDRSGSPPVALVNQTFVEQNFPDQDPLGERVRVTVSFGFGSPTWTIVGVVRDVRSTSLTRSPSPEVYVPHAQMGAGSMTVVVRARPGEDLPVAALDAIVSEMDPALPLRNAETMDRVMERQTATTRFYLLLLSVFAGLAVAMAAVGLYGVIAYLVSARRHEIGIRLALGARRDGVVRMVLTQAAGPTLGGLGTGLVTALAGARILERFLYQVDPRDPVVYVAVSVLLLGVAGAATFLPAREASRVDPGEALR